MFDRKELLLDLFMDVDLPSDLINKIITSLPEALLQEIEDNILEDKAIAAYDREHQ